MMDNRRLEKNLKKKRIIVIIYVFLFSDIIKFLLLVNVKGIY